MFETGGVELLYKNILGVKSPGVKIDKNLKWDQHIDYLIVN